jgi:hypothetical protein
MVEVKKKNGKFLGTDRLLDFHTTDPGNPPGPFLRGDQGVIVDTLDKVCSHVLPRTPGDEYRNRLEERRGRSVVLSRLERLIGNARVAVFLAGLGIAWLAFGAHRLSSWWLALPATAYFVLLVRHEQVTRSWHRARRAVSFYESGIARLTGNWRGRGQAGVRFLDEAHPYAADLDLFGTGSLFELLCTARTRAGEDTLARWLKSGAIPAEVRARQAAVAELRPQLDLREDLALLGSEVPAGVDFNAVAAWGEEPPVLAARWVRWLVRGLGLATTIALLGWVLMIFGVLDTETWFGAFFERWGSLPFGLLLPLQLALAGWLAGRVGRVLRAVEKRARDLALLASVLRRLERASFSSPRLAELRGALDTPTQSLAESVTAGKVVPPSQRIAQLGNLIDLLDSRRNQVFAPLAYLLMWGTQIAFAIDHWRRMAGPAVRRWLVVVGEFEALCALAGYGFENPDDPFPEILETGPCYEAEALGHPLVPGRCVPNDLSLNDAMRVLVVSGSNMSGKSTFLRTVGINAVLAQAGAPVRARRMRIAPLAVGATLRIQDSLQAGRSRFYAEILRVRQIVDLARGPIPLLFLLDEIFAGTNSHDRRLGAQCVVQGLVRAGAVGLVTTHDLSLTHIAEQLEARGTNVHFADHFENGEMSFDYRLRPGVVEHSNALALMRAVGLNVVEE